MIRGSMELMILPKVVLLVSVVNALPKVEGTLENRRNGNIAIAGPVCVREVECLGADLEVLPCAFQRYQAILLF